jgi:hypothetical protein
MLPTRRNGSAAAKVESSGRSKASEGHNGPSMPHRVVESRRTSPRQSPWYTEGSADPSDSPRRCASTAACRLSPVRRSRAPGNRPHLDLERHCRLIVGKVLQREPAVGAVRPSCLRKSRDCESCRPKGESQAHVAMVANAGRERVTRLAVVRNDHVIGTAAVHGARQARVLSSVHQHADHPERRIELELNRLRRRSLQLVSISPST